MPSRWSWRACLPSLHKSLQTPPRNALMAMTNVCRERSEGRRNGVKFSKRCIRKPLFIYAESNINMNSESSPTSFRCCICLLLMPHADWLQTLYLTCAAIPRYMSLRFFACVIVTNFRLSVSAVVGPFRGCHFLSVWNHHLCPDHEHLKS